MKEIVLDTETTGISLEEGHRIVEIGCIELENLIPTQKKFHEVVDEFIEFVKNKRLIIHNAEFDLAHLNNELSLVGKEKIQFSSQYKIRRSNFIIKNDFTKKTININIKEIQKKINL